VVRNPYPTKQLHFIREVAETVILTSLLFLLIHLTVQNFDVDGHSMEPTLHNTELILVDKWSYLFQSPARGDIIVFVAPPHPSEYYVKRIIGLPGDVISVVGSRVIVDGKTLYEPYVSPLNQGNPYPPIINLVIPPNAYFVLGDNRDGSSDSRDWGCVPRQNILGRALLVYWPLGENNIGFLPNASAVFDGIHRASTASAGITSDKVCRIETASVNAPAGYTQHAGNTSTPARDVSLDSLLLIAIPGISIARRNKRKRGA
jgi:signal peptidase I